MTNSLRLSEARERTPPVDPVQAMRNQLQLALFGAVSEADVIGMAAKLKEMALSGDLKAMKLFFSLVQTAAPPAVQIQQIVAHVVQVLRESEPVTPALPTTAAPGSEEKLLVMQQRAERGESLGHPDDAPLDRPTNGRTSHGR